MELNRKVGQAVVLNIYDLAPDLNMWLYGAGLGVYHSGIEVSGTEYSFASGAGIFEGSPKDAPGATFRESILLGEFKGSAADIRGVAASMRDDYSGGKYNIMSKNCNSFANDFSLNLINKPIPNWVNRLGYYGSFCSCFFPPEMQGSAPVGDASGSSGGGGRPFTQQPVVSRYDAFAGSGASLGGGGGGGGAGAKAKAAQPSAAQRDLDRQRRLERLSKGSSAD